MRIFLEEKEVQTSRSLLASACRAPLGSDRRSHICSTMTPNMLPPSRRSPSRTCASVPIPWPRETSGDLKSHSGCTCCSKRSTSSSPTSPVRDLGVEATIIGSSSIKIILRQTRSCLAGSLHTGSTASKNPRKQLASCLESARRTSHSGTFSPSPGSIRWNPGPPGSCWASSTTRCKLARSSMVSSSPGRPRPALSGASLKSSPNSSRRPTS